MMHFAMIFPLRTLWVAAVKKKWGGRIGCAFRGGGKGKMILPKRGDGCFHCLSRPTVSLPSYPAKADADVAVSCELPMIPTDVPVAHTF